MSYVHCITVCAIVNPLNQYIVDDLKTKINNKEDAKLWQGDTQWQRDTGIDSNGNNFLMASLRYEVEADMLTTLNWMKNKANIYKPDLLAPIGNERGSFVEAHSCNHKEVAESTPITGGCVIVFRWDK